MPRRLFLVPYLILASGLSVTALVVWYFFQETRVNDELRFQTLAVETEAQLESTMAEHVTALLGAAGLFALDDNVSGAEFHAYTQRLRALGGLRGLQGLGYASRMAGTNGDTHPVRLFEPFAGQHALELAQDISLDRTHREAMESARDVGAPVASAAIRSEPTQAGGHDFGFGVFVPVYHNVAVPSSVGERRAHLIGHVFSLFGAQELFSILLTPYQRGLTALEVFNHAGIAGDKLLTVGHPPPHARFHAMREVRIAGQLFTLHLVSLPGFPTSWSRSGVPLGAALGVAVTLLLFTFTRFQSLARSQAEAATQRVQEAREEAVSSLRARDAFLSVASHELKTPLTALQMHVDGLLRCLDRNFAPSADMVTWRRRLTSVARQSRRLSDLMDSLLGVAQIDTGEVELASNPGQPTHIGELVHELLERFQPACRGNGGALSLVGDADLETPCDRGRLDQVLSNLLSNAIKYGDGLPIVLRVAAQPGCITLDVQDHGIGIDPRHHQRVFDRYARAVSDRKYAGLGLGLWIARELVTAMGGTITVSSAVGEGSVFTVTVPRCQAQRSILTLPA